MTQRSQTIDLVRVASNLLVVLIHSYAAFQYCAFGTLEFKFWMFACNGFGSIAMPALFLMSGYLLFSGLTYANYGDKMMRRVKRLLIPYVVWNLTFIAFYLIAAHFVPRLHDRVVSFAINTWSGVWDKTLSWNTAPIDMPLWYMRTIFVYALASPLILFLLKCYKGVFCYVLVLTYFVVTSLMGLGTNLEFSYPAYSLLLFVVGAHLSIKKVPLVEAAQKRWLWPFAIAGTIGMGALFVDHWWDYSIWRDVCFICAAPMLFLMLPILNRCVTHLPHGCFEFLQRSSFFLYCGHFLFCSMLMHTVAPFLKFMTMGKFTVLVFVFVLGGGCVCWVAYAIDRKLLGRALSLWDGTL